MKNKAQQAMKNFVFRFRLDDFLVMVDQIPENSPTFVPQTITVRVRIDARWYAKTIIVTDEDMLNNKRCNQLEGYIRVMIDQLRKKIVPRETRGDA